MSTKRTRLRGKGSRVKIGILGCGAIGTGLALAIDRKWGAKTRLVALSDRVASKAEKLAKRLRHSPEVLSPDALIAQSDLIVECAQASVVPSLLKKAIQKRKDLLIMSTGGVLGKSSLLERARKAGCRITLPSGALFGIDGVKAASLLPIKKMVLTTRKPPRSFEGAPFVLRNRIRLGAIRKEKVVFRGNIKQAVKAFPQNINVAATLGLAGADSAKCEVRIIADPRVKRNSHEIFLEGPLGKLTARCENVPSKENPKTSRLAIFSALATLKALLDPVRVGT